MRRRIWTGAALAAVLALLLAACKAGDIPTLHRPDDPVVLTGAEVPQLEGTAPGRVVAFEFVFGHWVPVPVQVDERARVDLATIKHEAPIGVTALVYTDPATWTGADPDPTVDADDEIVFMAEDAFGRARSIHEGDVDYTLAEPSHVVPGSGVEVEVDDPLEPGARGWVYLFESDGTLDPAAGRSYVDYTFDLLSGDYQSTYAIDSGPNSEDSTVVTDRYSDHFADRWVMDDLAITAGDATGVDILDRHKSGFAGTCGRTTDTFKAGAGAFIANKSGPVRAIRSFLGANSGTYTERTHLMYEGRQDVVTDLRVHAIPPLRDWLDMNAHAIGMTFSSSTLPGGVTIDGVPDSVPTEQPEWTMVSGTPGSLVSTMAVDTSIAFDPSVYQLYYSDDATPTETQCTGDAFEYGAHGQSITVDVPCTDPARGCTDTLRTTRTLTYLPPDTTTAQADTVAAQSLAPLTTTETPFAP